jgi:hypothetical protein
VAYGTREENNAYYAYRNERARSNGFRGYAQERKYREEHREALDIAGQSAEWRLRHQTGDYRSFNPKMVVEFVKHTEEYGYYDEYASGEARHDLVAYYMDYEGMSVDDAIEAMREIYGRSGGSEE